MALLLLASLGCAGPPQPIPGPAPPGVRWTGRWQSNWGRMDLRQQGDRVEGTFEYRNGTLEGDLQGDLLFFDWIQPKDREAGQLGAKGKGWMRIRPDGREVKGRWGYREHREEGGTWQAERVPEDR